MVRSDMARGLAYGNRLNDVTPMLFITEEVEVSPGALYKNSEWIDPGAIQTKDYATPQLREMYGDVASYLYILKTSIGQEQNVAEKYVLDCLELVHSRISRTKSSEFSVLIT